MEDSPWRAEVAPGGLPPSREQAELAPGGLPKSTHGGTATGSEARGASAARAARPARRRRFYPRNGGWKDSHSVSVDLSLQFHSHIIFIF